MLRLSSRLLSSRGFASIPSVTDVHLVGCGIDYGAGRRGVDMGPSMVRFADIGPKLAEMGYSVHDRGNVSVPDKDTVEVPALHITLRDSTIDAYQFIVIECTVQSPCLLGERVCVKEVNGAVSSSDGKVAVDG